MQAVIDSASPKDFSTITRDIMLRNDRADAPLASWPHPPNMRYPIPGIVQEHP